MKLLIVFLTLTFALIQINAGDISNNQSQVVDDNISIDELIIDDGKEVINNQDIEKPKKDK